MAEEKNKNELPESLIANLDQFQTHVANMGMIVANFHEALKNNRVPEELAAKLTIDFNTALWAKMFFGQANRDE